MDETTPNLPNRFTPKLEQPKQKKSKIIYKGSMMDTDSIVEEIYTENNIAKFIILNRKTGQITYKDSYETENGQIIKPIIDEEVTRKFLVLPSDAIAYGSEEELIEEIKEHIGFWLDIPERNINFAVYNILRGWLYQRFHSLNYLRAQGDYGSGKSRYLDTIGLLHRQPFKTTATATPAALFRILNKWNGPTLVMDEADMDESDETVDTIKIINQGYEWGNPVIRCDPNDQTKIEFHNVYCPKVLATRKQFKDKAVESRCFTTYLKTTTRKNIPPNLNNKFFQKVNELQNKLLMYRLLNYDRINPEVADNFDFGDIEPRLKQISTSFVALFAEKPKELEEFKSFILETQKQLSTERSESWEGQILTAIVNLYVNGNTSPSGTEIVTYAGFKDKDGNLMKARSISGAMKSLGFGTAKLVRNGNYVSRNYILDGQTLIEQSKMYIDDKELVEPLRNVVTNVTASTEGGGVGATDSKGKGDNILGDPLIVPLQTLQRYKNPKSVTNVTDVTEEDLSDLTASKTEILGWLKQKGEIETLTFIDRFGDDNFSKLKESGDIFEPRSGWVRCLE